MTKTVECSYERCGDRRVHWQEPNTPRGFKRKIPVPLDHEGPVYCSHECWAYDEAVKKEKLKSGV